MFCSQCFVLLLRPDLKKWVVQRMSILKQL